MSILVGDDNTAEPTEEAVKACTGPCRRTLPLSSFGANSARRDGRRSECRQCRRERMGPRSEKGRAALALESDLLALLDDYGAEPSLADVLTRALEEVRQIGATGDRRAEQVEAVRRAVLIHGCRRVDEVVEETRLSRWAADHALAALVAAGVLETRDAFRLGDELEEAGCPVVEYHPQAYPCGEGFHRLFRPREADEEPHELEVQL